jgi:hypothetical protein
MPRILMERSGNLELAHTVYVGAGPLPRVYRAHGGGVERIAAS